MAQDCEHGGINRSAQVQQHKTCSYQEPENKMYSDQVYEDVAYLDQAYEGKMYSDHPQEEVRARPPSWGNDGGPSDHKNMGSRMRYSYDRQYRASWVPDGYSRRSKRAETRMHGHRGHYQKHTHRYRYHSSDASDRSSSAIVKTSKGQNKLSHSRKHNSVYTISSAKLRCRSTSRGDTNSSSKKRYKRAKAFSPSVSSETTAGSQKQASPNSILDLPTHHDSEEESTYYKQKKSSDTAGRYDDNVRGKYGSEVSSRRANQPHKREESQPSRAVGYNEPTLKRHHKSRRSMSQPRSEVSWISADHKSTRRERMGRAATRDASPSYDSEDDYRRSRSRERHRQRQQQLTIQKYCKSSEGDSHVFWDGFQWVRKAEGAPAYDQLMNATRKARRLHIGNLPMHMKITEEDFKSYLWKIMIERGMCRSGDVCPIVHVWFARDRGGNFGFMEMTSVEVALAALQLDGFAWHGVSVHINRPTDWKRAINDQAIKTLAGTSGMALAESVAAAMQQAIATGNSSGLACVLSTIPETHRAEVTEIMQQPSMTAMTIASHNFGLPLQSLMDKITSELLSGDASRIVLVSKPCSNLESNEDLKDILEDVIGECEKFGGIISALIITESIKQKVGLGEIGDIYIQFATASQADNCILNLSGRMYEGRPIRMSRFDEQLWNSKLKPHSDNIFLASIAA